MQGYGRGDFEGFIELVPMADAEIVRLQSDGYAYLH
jgi:intracellular sulfur oxidation DsrE/DsrF family protein